MARGIDVRKDLEVKETFVKFEKCLWQARN
jgi:hypothetical protein